MRRLAPALALFLVIGGAAAALAAPSMVGSGPSTDQSATNDADAATPTCAPTGTSSPPASSPPIVPPSAAAGEVALLPATGLSGERMYTLGDVAVVEEVGALEVLQAWRGYEGSVPPPDGQASYTFLVRFAWDGTQPEFMDTTGIYYNSIGFSMRDDDGFEYSNLPVEGYARTPTLLFGELAVGQSVQGWVTFHAPADAAFVELVYSPIVDPRAFFRVMAP